LKKKRLDVRPGDVRPPQAARDTMQVGGETHETPPSNPFEARQHYTANTT